LAKQPDDRYRSAAALARDLRASLRGEPIEARPYTWVVRLLTVFNRRHQVVLLHDWSKLLFLLGLTVLVGCGLINLWQEVTTKPEWPILLTKLVQVAVMIFLVVRLRPPGELTSVERQIWCLVPAYYGGFFTILALNGLLKWFSEPTVPVEPILAVMSGMAFVTLGAGVWGRFYVWGGAFFGLALLMVVSRTHYGMLLLGLGWFVCLSVSSFQLRWRR
jgi:hypothetical protein